MIFIKAHLAEQDTVPLRYQLPGKDKGTLNISLTSLPDGYPPQPSFPFTSLDGNSWWDGEGLVTPMDGVLETICSLFIFGYPQAKLWRIGQLCATTTKYQTTERQV